MTAPSPSSSWVRRRLPLLIGSVVCAGLIGTLGLSPAWAQGGDAAAASPVVGDFALGDGAEGLIDERTGAVVLTLPVAAGLAVKWSSAAVGSNDDLLGDGWGWAGLGRVSVDGGVRVFPTSGTGVYEADSSYDSGMAGYLTGDAAFAVADGEVLPARADGRAGERPYRFVMAELGGTRTYYSAEGRPVAQVDLHGNRTDYEWVDEKLTRVVDPLGVVTELVWEGTRRITVTSRAGEAGAPGVSTMQATLELSQKRLVGVVDPTGARTSLRYDGELIAGIEGPSGAVTEVTWGQPALDGTVPVDRIAVVDDDSRETLSSRTWQGTGSASGWPAQAASATYETVVSDGQSRVISTYASNSLLLERRLDVATPAGRKVMQEQSFSYPGTDGSTTANPAAPPANWTKPERAELVYRDEAGRERTVTGEYEYDELGRPTKQVENDGTVMTTTYDDDAVPRPELLPGDVAAPAVGLPVSQRVRTSDGLVRETRSERNSTGTAIVATETFSGGDGELLVRTGRAEMIVDFDGFVSREAVFPQGGAGEPFVTEYERVIDPLAGKSTLTQTDAAGTPDAIAATTVTDLLIGQPVEQVDVLGNRTLIEYDEAGREVVRTDASGRTTSTDYNVRQLDGVNSTSVTDPAGVIATEERDAIGRVVRLTDNIDHGEVVAGHERVVERREYPTPASVRVTDAWGASSVATRDVLGRVVRTELPNGLVQIASYDDVGGTVTSGLSRTGDLEGAEAVATEVLDERGAVTERGTRRDDGAATQTAVMTHDGLGRTIETSDGRSRNAVTFDAFGNVATSTTTLVEAENDAPSLVAERRYDGEGNSVQKTLTADDDPSVGAERVLDVFGRMVSRTDRGGQTTEWKYSADGLVEHVESEHGRVTTNSYDPTTRALIETRTESPLGESVRRAFEHDPVTGAVTFAFDPADRAATEIAYEYDAWGNVTSTTYPGGKSISHEFDENGREIAITDIAGNRTRFEHDATGLISRAFVTGAECAPEAVAECEAIAEVAYSRDDYGRVVVLDRGNGARTHFEYTSVNQIAAELTTDASGEVIADRSYEYDAQGNVITRAETVREPSGELAHETTEYAYDSFNRLLESSLRVERNDSLISDRRTEYELTVDGDIAQERVVETADGAAKEVTRQFEYGPIGELVAITTDGERSEQKYNAAGSLVEAADGTVYGYNATGQIVEETGPDGTIRTEYWADGSRRALATVESQNGTESRSEFYWDGADLINDAHTSDSSSDARDLASYLTAGGRHARIVQSQAEDVSDTSYLVADRHGSTTHLLNDDGAIETAYAYTDYGVTTERSGPAPDVATPDDVPRVATEQDAGIERGIGDATRNPIQFAGELTDDTGDQYLRTRMYDAGTMRFTGPDFEQLWTLFGFADLNPITKVDPSGRNAASDAMSWTAIGVAALAMIVGVVSVAATVVSGGLAALGLAGGIAAAVDVLASGYSVAIGVGTQIATHRPEWQSEAANAFFRSDAAIWSELVVGAAAGAAVYLAGKAFMQVTASSAWKQANWIADELLMRYKKLGVEGMSKEFILDKLNRTLDMVNPQIMGNADARNTMLAEWGLIRGRIGGTVDAGPAGTPTIRVIRPDMAEQMTAYADGIQLASAFKGPNLEPILSPLQIPMRRLMIRSDTTGTLFTPTKYTPDVTFIDEATGRTIYFDHLEMGRPVGGLGTERWLPTAISPAEQTQLAAAAVPAVPQAPQPAIVPGAADLGAAQ